MSHPDEVAAECGGKQRNEIKNLTKGVTQSGVPVCKLLTINGKFRNVVEVLVGW